MESQVVVHHVRAPKTLRALGTVVCMQGLAAMLFGPDRARAILEWEAMQGAGDLPPVIRYAVE